MLTQLTIADNKSHLYEINGHAQNQLVVSLLSLVNFSPVPFNAFFWRPPSVQPDNAQETERKMARENEYGC